MKRTDSTRALSQLIILVAAIIAIGTLYFARVVFVPFALAVLFTFLLAPIVTFLDRIHIPRGVSAPAVVILTMLVIGSVGWFSAGQMVEVANQLPYYRTNIRDKIASLHSSNNRSINKAANAVNEIGKELVAANPSSESAPEPTTGSNQAKTLAPQSTTPAKPIPVEIVPPASNPFESLNGFIGPVTTFGIVIIFTLFILLRREDLRNRFIRLVGHSHLNVMTQALDDASSRVSRYLILQLGINTCYGLVIGFGLYLIGVPHALLWGALATLLRFLPYIGAPLSAIFPILLSLAMFNNWNRPLMTLALYITVELLVANVIEPLLYGSHVGLSSLAILVAAVFWTVLWGPIGLVLSTPLTVCLVVIGRYVPNLEFLNILLGDEPVLSPESHFYQRLLASDAHEAKEVLEKYLKDTSLQQLYGFVIVPALALAEQDRHHNNLDEDTEQFITLCTKELVEELGYRNNPASDPEVPDASAKPSNGAHAGPSLTIPERVQTIVSVPARDDADEIVGTMLAQLLEQTGHRTQSVSIGPSGDMIAAVQGAKPDVVCISALPPFAISHARKLYLELRAHSPAFKIIVGLWGFSGDPSKISGRMRLAEDDRILVSLDQVLSELNGASIGQIADTKNPESPVLVPGPTTEP